MACPAIRHHEVLKQGDEGDTQLVPGGFLHYVLFEKAPGVQLNWDLFWGYGRGERDAIRCAFREAWLYVDDLNSFGWPSGIVFPDWNRSLVL
jgi:hypothetical protein